MGLFFLFLHGLFDQRDGSTWVRSHCSVERPHVAKTHGSKILGGGMVTLFTPTAGSRVAQILYLPILCKKRADRGNCWLSYFSLTGTFRLCLKPFNGRPGINGSCLAGLGFIAPGIRSQLDLEPWAEKPIFFVFFLFCYFLVCQYFFFLVCSFPSFFPSTIRQALWWVIRHLPLLR